MPVVFDEVSATVEPESATAPRAAAGPPEPDAGGDDPRSLGRELHRRAVREARLRAD